MTLIWSDWASELVVDIQGLLPRQFIVLECLVGLSANPYVQVARELDATWYCEVGSAANFATECWPADALALIRTGWDPPDSPSGNWYRYCTHGGETVGCLVEGLRLARGCTDPVLMVGRRGQWPAPPPDHGAPTASRPSPFDLAA